MHLAIALPCPDCNTALRVDAAATSVEGATSTCRWTTRCTTERLLLPPFLRRLDALARFHRHHLAVRVDPLPIEFPALEQTVE